MTMRSSRSGFLALARASAFLLTLFLFLTPVAAQQGQSHGVAQRLAAVEAQVAAVIDQLAALTARVTTLESLPARVTALEARASLVEARATALENRTAATFSTSVDCTSGQTISSVLAQTGAHTGTVQIFISGVCTESFTVTRARTIIQGDAPGATIRGTSGATAVRLSSNGGATPSLLLSNLTISGAQTAVSVDSGAHVQLVNVTLTDNVMGVSLSGRSEARLFNTTIDLPAAGSGVAVDVRDGAFVAIVGGAIRNHANYALQLQNGAVADVRFTQITGNQNGGGPGSIRGAVGLYGGSSMRLTGTSITDNVGNGVFVAMGSVLYLQNGVSISNNTAHGISASDGAVVGKFFVTTDVHINHNGGYGISCSAAPGLAQLYGFPSSPGGGQQPIETTGNSAGGINPTCQVAPVPY
jgi:hypothetical protein